MKAPAGFEPAFGHYTGTPDATHAGFIPPYSSVASDNTIRETLPALHSDMLLSGQRISRRALPVVKWIDGQSLNLRSQIASLCTAANFTPALAGGGDFSQMTV